MFAKMTKYNLPTLEGYRRQQKEDTLTGFIRRDRDFVHLTCADNRNNPRIWLMRLRWDIIITGRVKSRNRQWWRSEEQCWRSGWTWTAKVCRNVLLSNKNRREQLPWVVWNDALGEIRESYIHALFYIRQNPSFSAADTDICYRKQNVSCTHLKNTRLKWTLLRSHGGTESICPFNLLITCTHAHIKSVCQTHTHATLSLSALHEANPLTCHYQGW